MVREIRNIDRDNLNIIYDFKEKNFMILMTPLALKDVNSIVSFNYLIH